MSERFARRCLAALILAAGIYVFWDVGRPFMQGDEFWYAGTVTHMLEQGSWLTLWSPSGPYIAKPPLYCWLSAGVFALMPILPLAMRLLPGLSFMGSVWLVGQLSRHMDGLWAGLLGAAIFILNYDQLYNHGYKSGVIEGLLSLELAAVLWLNGRLRDRPGLLRIMGALTGLIFMTKTAFAGIAVLITGLNLWWLRTTLRVPRRVFVEAVGLAAAVSLPWIITLTVVYGAQALKQLFVWQIWQRMVGSPNAALLLAGEHFGRTEAWYILRHFLAYGQPWSLVVWPALWWLWRARHRLPDDRRRLLMLSAAWLLAVLAVFLISRGRWCWYALSVYVPVSVLMAVVLDNAAAGTLGRDTAVFAAVTAAACLVSPAPLVHDPYRFPAGGAPLLTTQPDQIIVAGLLIPAFLLLAFPGRLRTRKPRPWLIPGLMGLTAAVCMGMALWNMKAPPAAQAVGVFLRLGLIVPVFGWCIRTGTPRSVGRGLLAALLVLSAGYLAAPLRYAGTGARRAEVRWMEAMIDQRKFANGGTVMKPNENYYTYMILSQAFERTHEFAFDSTTRSLIARQRH